ncbi:hypothetical protein LTR53_005487 [Teratosphaeriaceae sp. CCFEE 6253]|nr:hypothetical protein LTR53_005487 [Teratosphaeriaceae sp. CCFEE 6253]
MARRVYLRPADSLAIANITSRSSPHHVNTSTSDPDGLARMASASGYKPTSLDYISRPNPLEPQSVPQTHPLDGTPQLLQAPNKDFLRILHNANDTIAGERPTKRRKSADVRQSTKRLRIPPTLSGLHQPPPNARLLPSISIEQPEVRREPVLPSDQTLTTAERTVLSVPGASTSTGPRPALTKTKKLGRNRWSDEETACLLKGVAVHGIGAWKTILNCQDYQFKKRSALDLKDRFRVCCPDDYQHKKRRSSTCHNTSNVARPEGRPSRRDCKSSAELQDLGIDQPFAKVQRRSRCGYTGAEDQALLKGFTKHGSQWALIRADEELSLEHRTATDLRDRMRTKYPKGYANAGLASRPDVFPKPANRGNDTSTHEAGVTAAEPEETTRPVVTAAPTASSRKSLEPKKQAPTFLFAYDDVFFGAPFDNDEDEQAEPITLDRGILDWPLEPAKFSAYDISKTTNDPTVNLNLPRRVALQSAGGTSSALPSLATITALSDFGELGQLELPSLMLDSDGRAGGHFLGFDELLS